MNIKITYRHKKSGISMRVLKSGDISISAPYGVTREQILAFVDRNQDWIAQARERVANSQKRADDFYSRVPLTTRQEAKAASETLWQIIEPFIEKYEVEMGVCASKYSFSRAKGRWGSCNPRTRSIRFSIYLLLLPHWCIEHVVVHELAHLIVPNHSHRFYEVMDRHFPAWRQARAETKRIVKDKR